MPFKNISLLQWCAGIVSGLFVVYIGLIAVVMSYASLTIEFSQSIKNDESSVAALDSRYLASIAAITDTDYAADGYALPSAKLYVPAKSVTAVR
ncbi:hypothetical protein KGM48_02405 [Patescibacteria group bacterium]|nr:hypothetical protein [Patescibacteria group bacterium]